ncbi:SDR family oxidoreductase [Deinococcus sp. Arct2-2]|uniref:SDR family oxidoreductase n=1 Tax=Deinococcus sp. Arct2-2 TaxID=2568653 RepID=UPI0010A39594|nr:SDR family oxidoreductase [Deinococcus sp. Arct2-2]THF70845.1 SDR family oxidoreductase [Deinococcus sp. Arct2-2]
MILVTGATGKLGRIVVQHLLKDAAPDQIAVLVRDESKAADLKAAGVSVRVGHYDDLSLLGQAMQGIDRVLLIAGTDEERRVQQHQNVIDAAKQAGVQGIAYTSRTLKDRSTLANKLMEGHFQTEDAVRASGLNYAVFRNVLYMDALPQFVGEQVFETGIRLPAGQGRVAFALRSDMGEAIANSLLNDQWNQTTYHLTGTEPYSFEDVAAELTRLSGKAVAYYPVEAAAFEAQMIGRGVPPVVAQRVAGFMTDIKNGQEDEISPDLERLLGRRPALLGEGLRTLFAL